MASEGKIVIAQGRLVWTSGDLFGGRAKLDLSTRQPKLDQQGNQVQEYGFGLSISKAELGASQAALWNAMHDEARALYSSGQYPPAFAWKYKDGDGVDHNGAPFGNREGYPGCLVFAMTTTIPPRFFRWEGGQNVQVADGIKCGDYVEVQCKVVGHGAVGQAKPGLYLNPMAVRLVAPGKEIVNVATGDQIFGMGAPATPPGYVAPPAPAPMPLVAPPPPPMTPGAPQPHYAIIPPTHQPAYPMAAPAPAPAAGMPLPGAPSPYPAHVVGAPPAPTPAHGMPVPTGYPPAPAPMAAYPGSPLPPPIPGVPR